MDAVGQRRRITRAVALLAALVLGTVGTVVTGIGPASAATGVGTKADDGAEVVKETWGWDFRTLTLQIKSPAVGQTVPVLLKLPNGWNYETTKTFPLTLMLHGGNDDYTSWTRETDISKLSAGWDTIVAMPDAGRTATYTNYYNGGKFGSPAWETFHTVELLQILERGYHASKVRAVAGLSAGGYGAMIYAARNPGMFKYAASYSGATAIRIPVMRYLMYTAAGDKDPALRFGTPFVDEANWEQRDPLYLAKNLKGTGLFVSSGTTGAASPDDTVKWDAIQFVEAGSGVDNNIFVAKLKMLGIPVTSHFYTLGEHAWVSWQKELHTSWPLMMKAIGAKAN